MDEGNAIDYERSQAVGQFLIGKGSATVEIVRIAARQKTGVHLVADNLLFSIILKVSISLEATFNQFSEFCFEMSKVID